MTKTLLLLTIALLAPAVSAEETTKANNDPRLYSISADIDRQTQELSELTGKKVWRHGQWAVIRLNKDDIDKLPETNRQALTPLTLAALQEFFPNIKTPPTMGQEIVSILNSVKTEEIEEDIKTLIAFPGRRVNSKGNELATEWLMKQYADMGYDTRKHCFKKYGKRPCNVVAIKRGKVDDQFILVVAHFDAVKGTPGAVDNASGSAGLLALGRALAKLDLRHSLVLLASNSEEEGMDGARAFIDDVKRRGKLSKIKLVMDMDCIGYNKDKQNIVYVETNPPFEKHAIIISMLTLGYTDLYPKIITVAEGSDHEPFLKKHIPAFLTIQEWNEPNPYPYYHQPSDTIDRVDFRYTADVVRLNVVVAYLTLVLIQ